LIRLSKLSSKTKDASEIAIKNELPQQYQFSPLNQPGI
jgi:hypothetical protein